MCGGSAGCHMGAQQEYHAAARRRCEMILMRVDYELTAAPDLITPSLLSSSRDHSIRHMQSILHLQRA
jgi:hypothetical protein